MEIREVHAKTILTKSSITDYCVNPYMGCFFGCSYCYAQLIIRKFHPGKKWGSYVDVKINAPELLEKEIKKAKKGIVWFSSVTDPYQPLERKYELTRKCLAILLEHDFPVTILTKSPLVTRDIDLFKKFNDCTVGITITTDNEKIKNLFEPNTPNFLARVTALKELHESNIRTYAFFGPLLPMNARSVTEKVAPYIESAFIDKPNYPQLWRSIAKENGIEMNDTVHNNAKKEIQEVLNANKIKAETLF